MARAAFVGMFGLNRYPDLTEESILTNILKPLNTNFDVVNVIAHFNVPTVIDNKRSGEFVEYSPRYFNGISFEKCVYEVQDNSLIMENYRSCSSYPLFGEMDEGSSTRKNLLFQLHSLKRLYEIANESFNLADFDVFLIIRPDLKYLDRIQYSDLSKILCGKKDLIVPFWQSCGGINDRFCITNMNGFRTYTDRVNLVESFCSRKGYMHAERLNYFSANTAQLRIDYMKTRACRVRAGGVIVRETFSDNMPQRLRRTLRRIENFVSSRDVFPKPFKDITESLTG